MASQLNELDTGYWMPNMLIKPTHHNTLFKLGKFYPELSGQAYNILHLIFYIFHTILVYCSRASLPQSIVVLRDTFYPEVAGLAFNILLSFFK